MTGRDILAERKKRGIAQNTLADARGVPSTVIGAIENEDIEVTPRELVNLWNLIEQMVSGGSQIAENAA